MNKLDTRDTRETKEKKDTSVAPTVKRDTRLDTLPGGATVYTGETPDTGRVLLDDLLIDRTYQRDYSESKVQQISRRFDERASGHLVVSVRADGTKWIIDGQHRYYALKRLGRPDALCTFWYGLTRAEEAALFVEYNFARAVPRSTAVYRARLVAGDPVVVDIQSVIDELGLRVVNAVTTRKRAPGGV